MISPAGGGWRAQIARLALASAASASFLIEAAIFSVLAFCLSALGSGTCRKNRQVRHPQVLLSHSSQISRVSFCRLAR